MRLFVVSLAVPFLVCIVGYAWLRIIAEEWLPAGVRPIPNLFWLSTVLVIGSSLTGWGSVAPPPGAARGEMRDSISAMDQRRSIALV